MVAKQHAILLLMNLASNHSNKEAFGRCADGKGVRAAARLRRAMLLATPAVSEELQLAVEVDLAEKKELEQPFVLPDGAKLTLATAAPAAPRAPTGKGRAGPGAAAPPPRPPS